MHFSLFKDSKSWEILLDDRRDVTAFLFRITYKLYSFDLVLNCATNFPLRMHLQGIAVL